MIFRSLKYVFELQQKTLTIILPDARFYSKITKLSNYDYYCNILLRSKIDWLDYVALMPLSSLFQLYYCGQFYRQEKASRIAQIKHSIIKADWNWLQTYILNPSTIPSRHCCPSQSCTDPVVTYLYYSTYVFCIIGFDFHISSRYHLYYIDICVKCIKYLCFMILIN